MEWWRTGRYERYEYIATCQIDTLSWFASYLEISPPMQCEIWFAFIEYRRCFCSSLGLVHDLIPWCQASASQQQQREAISVMVMVSEALLLGKIGQTLTTKHKTKLKRKKNIRTRVSQHAPGTNEYFPSYISVYPMDIVKAICDLVGT